MLDSVNPSELRERYREAKPWPHLVADDIVAPELAVDVAAEVSRLPGRALVPRRSRRQVKLTSAGTGELGARTRAMLNVLSSPAITELAEIVTGIRGLEADREFCRAGVFVTPPGGWQRVHEDFPVHPVTGLWNRVVVLLYCSDWDRSWGGELELWRPDMSAVGVRIEPRPGRLVMFETTSTHPHGIERLTADADARVVLASRLYARAAPADRPSPPLRRWAHRPDERRRDIWPTASEAARELRARLRRTLRPAPAHHGRHDAGY